jgi:hypothetical protein
MTRSRYTALNGQNAQLRGHGALKRSSPNTANSRGSTRHVLMQLRYRAALRGGRSCREVVSAELIFCRLELVDDQGLDHD